MTDITNLFKATVKTVKLREKAQGTAVGPDKSILPTHKQKSEFSTHAKDVVATVSKLRDFLIEHRKDYINANGYLGAENSKMTDADRDRIDTDTEAFIKTCFDAIKQLKSQVHAHKVLRQVKDHKDALLELIEKYLTAVCQLYSEQRAVRVKRVVDRKCLSRLESQARLKTQLTAKTDRQSPTDPQSDNPSRRLSDEKVPGSSVTAPSLDYTEVEGEEEISAEEAQMLQLENEQLYEEMSSMVDEVRQIEGKIVEISRLQEIFADKVLEQEKEIDKISGTVVDTTENIKEANEEIREAMKNNAGFRVWILFFLIVCSCSLLFLDWYNA